MSASASTPSIHDHWITHPQARLFARSWTPAAASRAPIVLLHDSLGSVALWREFPAQLAEATGRQVWAYDRWGYGQSDARTAMPARNFVRDESTDVFPIVLQQLGLAHHVLLGHSVGSGMGLEMAARNPDCLALITIAGQAFVEDRTLAGIREAQVLFQDAEQLARLARYHGDKARWVVNAWTDTWLSAPFADWSVDDCLPHVRCPVLALHGEHDEYGSAAHPQRIAAGVSGPAQAVLLPGAHHMPHREMPAQVLAHITRFLQPVD